jgi:hypothetical protein
VVLEEAEAAAHDFTAFRASTISSLTAALQLPPGFTRVLTAQLLPATAASAKPGSTAAAAAVLTSTRVDASGFFELRGLSQGAYVLRVLCEGAASGAACGPWDTPVEVRPCTRLYCLCGMGCTDKRGASARVMRSEAAYPFGCGAACCIPAVHTRHVFWPINTDAYWVVHHVWCNAL